MNQIVPPNRKARRVRDAMMSHAAPVALALEPRYMFDAAGAATGVDALREATADATAAEHDGASSTDGADDDAALAAASAAHQLPADDGTEAPASVAPEPQRKEVVFIDAGVQDHEALAAAVGEGVEVVILDASQDGLAQMAAWADGKSGYDAIHVMSHGAEGTVQLGTLTLTSENLAARAADLASLGGAMGDGGDILLYGCTVGSDSSGQQFLDGMAAATGADVAASDDLTGAAYQGGDWDLEVASGHVETDAYALSGYEGVLDLTGVTGSITIDNGNVGIPNATIGAGTEWDLSGGLNELLLDINPSNNTITFTINNSNWTITHFEVNFSGASFGSVDSISAPTINQTTGTAMTGYSAIRVNDSQFKFNVQQDGTTRTGTVTYTYTSTAANTNDNPSITGLPSDVAVTEETASNLDLSAATVADPNAADILTVTLTASSGTMAASSGGSVTVGGSTTGTLTLTGTAANIDTYLNTASNIQYTGASNVSGDNAATVTVTVQDNAGSPVVNAGTVNLDITDINDAPTVSANASQPTGGFTEGGAAQQLFNLDSISTIESTQTVSSFAFSVTGLHDGASEMVTIDGQDFALNGGGGTTTNGGHTVGISGGTVTVTFGTGQSTANAVSFIDAITYKNTSENPTAGNRTFTLNAVQDSGGTAGTGAADTVNPNLARTIGVTAVNDDPTATGLPGGPIAAAEETATDIDLSALTLSDADGDTTVTLKLGVTNGTLAAAGAAGITVGGTGTALTLTGTVSALNTYLDTTTNITYTGNTNYAGPDTLTVAVNDGGNTGSGGGTDVALGTITLNVTNVNDAPTVAGLPSDVTVTEDVASNLDLSAVTLGDVDPSDTLTVTLTASAGTMAATSGGNVTVGGSGTGTLTLSGSAADIDTFLNTASNIQYTGASQVNGDNAATLSVTVNDGAGSGDINAGTVNIDITAVNDAPAVGGIGAGPQSVVAGTGLTDVTILDTLTLTDVDSADFNGGTLTIARTSGAAEGNWGAGGAAFTAGQDVTIGTVDTTDTGQGGADLVIALDADATPAAVRDFLRSLQYDGQTTQGTRNFTLTVVDGDGTANGGADTGTASFSIAVQPNPPVITGLDGASRSHTESDSGFTTLAGGAVGLTDADTTDFAGGTVTVTLTANGAAGDLLGVEPGNNITVAGTEISHNGTKIADITQAGSNTQPLIITFAAGGAADATAAAALLGQIGYRTASDAPSTADRTITVSMNDGNGATSATQTVTMAVAGSDDQPVIGGVSAGQGVLDTATVQPFSATTITEADGEAVTVTITLDDAAKGSFTTLNGFTDAGGGTYTFTGTAAAAQTAIQGMVFTPTPNRVAPGQTETTTFTISVEDADGSTDPVTDATTTVVSTSVNTAPTVGNVGGETSSVVAGTGAQALGLAADAAIGDVDSANFDGGVLTLTQTGGTANGNWGVDGTTVTAGGDGVLAAGETITVGGVAIGTVHASNTGQGGVALEIALNGDATPARVQTLVQNLTYSAPSGLGARAFTLTVNDGDGTANVGDADTTANFTIDVTPNPPVVGGLDGGTVTFTEGGTAVRLDADGNATVTDADSADFNGGTITVSITSGGTAAEDVLKVLDNATDGVSVTGGNVSVGGTLVGTVAGGTGGVPLTLTLNADATPARVQLVLRNIAYENTNGDNPSNASRTVSVQVTDGTGGTSTASTVTVGVTPVNDAPTITTAAIGGANTEHQGTLVFGTDFVDGIADVDAGDSFANATITARVDTGGGNPYLTGDQLGITSANNLAYDQNTGVLTYFGNKIADVGWDGATGTMTVQFINDAGVTGAHIAHVMNHITFWTTNDDPTQKGTTPNRTIAVTVGDGGNTGTGGPQTASISGTITITDANDTGTLTVNNPGAPVFQASAVTVAPNLTLTDVDDTQVTGAIISIVSPDGAAETLTLTGTFGTISPGDIAGSGTDTITISGTHSLADIQAAMRAVQYADASGTPTPGDRTVRFTVGERGSAGATADATVSVNAAPVIAVNAGVPVDEGATVTLTTAMLSATDANHAPSALTFTVGQAPANGTLLLNGAALSAGGTFTQADLAAGNVTYRHNGSETTADGFTVTVSDGLTTTSASTVSVAVTPTNDAPSADPGVLTPLEGENGTALSYAVPPTLFADADGDPLTITASGLPEGLVLSADGTRISGVPSGAPGTYSVVLTAADATGATVSATLTITIQAPPQAPAGGNPVGAPPTGAPPAPPGPPPGLNPPGLGDSGTPVAAGLNGGGFGMGQNGAGTRSPVTGGLGSQSPIDNSGSPVKTGLGTNGFGTGGFSPARFYGATGFGNGVGMGGGGLNQALNGGFGAGGVFGGGGQGGGLGGTGAGSPGNQTAGGPGLVPAADDEGLVPPGQAIEDQGAAGQSAEGETAMRGAPGFTSRLAALHQQFDQEADRLARSVAELEAKAPQKVA